MRSSARRHADDDVGHKNGRRQVREPAARGAERGLRRPARAGSSSSDGCGASPRASSTRSATSLASSATCATTSREQLLALVRRQVAGPRPRAPRCWCAGWSAACAARARRPPTRGRCARCAASIAGQQVLRSAPGGRSRRGRRRPRAGGGPGSRATFSAASVRPRTGFEARPGDQPAEAAPATPSRPAGRQQEPEPDAREVVVRRPLGGGRPATAPPFGPTRDGEHEVVGALDVRWLGRAAPSPPAAVVCLAGGRQLHGLRRRSRLDRPPPTR